MPEDFTTKESEAERESRLLLNTFLTITDPLLERLLQDLVLRSDQLAHRGAKQLQRIWNSARENLSGVIRTIHIGLSRARRRALQQIGMFGDALAAKWELLSFDIQEGAVKRILKRLNSMLSSLSKVFPALHAVKEYKDQLEATVEGLKEAPEFIKLGDLLKPR
jgi:hypothetical protein